MLYRALLLFIAIISITAAAHAQSALDSVRINELMYAPDSTSEEFIEIFNAASQTITLTNWKVWVKSRSVTLPVFQLPSQGFVVISKDTSKVLSQHSTPLLAIQLALPALSNSGSSVTLRTPAGQLIDSVSYDPKWGGSLGRSLERKEWYLPNDSTNWASCSSSKKATPGAINSITPPQFGIGIKPVSHFFSHDSLHVSFRFSNYGRNPSGTALLSIAFDSVLVTSLTIPSLLQSFTLDTNIIIANVPAAQFTLQARVKLTSDSAIKDTFSISFPAGLLTSHVVINEIMYASTAPEPEWIELYHSGTGSLVLSGCKIREHGTEYLIPSVIIDADSFLVLTGHDSLLRVTRPVRYAIARVDSMSNFPSLSNSGGALALIDARDELIDSAIFAPALGGGTGASLERIAWDKPGYDSANWSGSTDSSKATMGFANSNRERECDLAITSMRDSSLPDRSLRLWITVKNLGRDTITGASVSVMSLLPVSTTPLGSLTLPTITSGDSVTVQTDILSVRLGRNLILAQVSTNGDEVAANDTLSKNVIVPIERGDLLLNEIMYAPATGSCQWIEFYNNSTRPIETSSITLSTTSGASHLLASLPSIEIAASGFAVLAADSLFYASFRAPSLHDSLMQLSRSSLYLGTACTIALTNGDSLVIDTLASTANWLGRSSLGGISLERISTSRATLDTTNWQPSISLEGGTPLAPNSVSDHTQVSASLTLLASPNPFSPDGDGRDDVSNIAFAFGFDGEAATTLRVMDLNGRPVRTLLNGQTFYRQGQASFDGKRDDGTRLPIGLYVLMLDATDLSGVTHSTRTGVVIAKRH